jgi:hypothetical protein
MWFEVVPLRQPILADVTKASFAGPARRATIA